jgi:two-component system OmpR family response regulator
MQPLVRILYAENEPDIQQVVSLVLNDFGGFILKVCSSGAEAVNEIEAFTPQLLLLDVMMPHLDGLEALEEIRKIPAYSEIPVIFLTAKVHPDEVQRYFEMGALEVIIKPFDPITLVDQINQAWAKLSC